MKYSFKIGSLWGIPIEIHITFVLLMVLEFLLSFPELYFFAFTLLLFVFVVVHELSHSVVARHYGIKVRKIVLYPIGGFRRLRRSLRTQVSSGEWLLRVLLQASRLALFCSA